MTKILFILKRREDFDPAQHTKIGMQTGLYNSAAFVNSMLEYSSIPSAMSIVIDNNDIDKEVTLHKPSHVIIEALWVTPAKFNILCKLHPTVKWIIRLHSETPFLAQEGMAFDWLGDYVRFPNILVAANSPRMMDELSTYFTAINPALKDKIIYLPNFYPAQYKQKSFDRNKDYIDIGCFGAVRPLKNQLIQAIAALKFATIIGKKLRFHINGRVEQKGDSVMRNLQSMFQHLTENGHELIMHSWAPRDEFLTICATMDIGMQVSFSETFNIVGADLISQGVPLVSSDELVWADRSCCVSTTDSDEICQALRRIYQNPDVNVLRNQIALTEYTSTTQQIWATYFTLHD